MLAPSFYQTELMRKQSKGELGKATRLGVMLGEHPHPQRLAGLLAVLSIHRKTHLAKVSKSFWGAAGSQVPYQTHPVSLGTFAYGVHQGQALIPNPRIFPQLSLG